VPNSERLISCALIRDGVTHDRGFKEHWKLRAALGDADPSQKQPDDIYGFITSTGRFVTRREAMPIALAAGQISRPQQRELLSSDLDW
jgi:hypothetical protein